MIEFRHVADRFFNRPLWLQPSTAEMVGGFLLSRMSDLRAGKGGGTLNDDSGETRQYFRPTEGVDGSIEAHSSRASRFYGDYQKGEDGRPLPYRRTNDGTAILTLVGEWVNRGAWVGASSGLISYEGFSFQMRKAAQDPQTRAILLDLESPGGEAVGAFEAAAVVREVAAVKPVVAIVNGLAASAAYAIASGASRIVTIPTGISGSIGVVLMHLDLSKWLEDEGIKPTLIFAGDHKVDGNPFEPLPKDVRKDMQAAVSGFYDQFVETVAVGRSMDPAKVRNTQARVFKGEDAVAAGLADAVGSFESALSDMQSALPGQNRGATMTTSATTTTSTTDANAAAAAPDAAAIKAAEKTRVSAILGAKESAGRATMAQHLALETDMSADAAIALLSKSPKEPEARGSRLDGNVPQPKVDSSEPLSDPAKIAASWDSVVADINKESARGAVRR